MGEDSQAQIQQMLFEARKLVCAAGNLQEAGEGGELHFMGMVFESGFGWFTPDGGLQEASDWNSSDCVIGSAFAAGYGMHGWKDLGRAENLDEGWQRAEKPEVHRKERVLFWLRRRLKNVEAQGPDHVSLARQGLSYTERMTLERQLENERDSHIAEVESLREAIRFIEEESRG